MVCCRLREVARAPELLRDVHVDARGARVLPTFRALPPWLARHAAHVRQLYLVSFASSDMRGEEESEAAGLVSRCIEACGAAGQLQELHLCCQHPALLPWPAMRSLSCLSLTASFPGGNLLPPAISSLSNLQSLAFSPMPRFTAAVRLPPSITSLELEAGHEELWETELPPQVRCRRACSRVDCMLACMPACVPPQRAQPGSTRPSPAPLSAPLQVALLSNLRSLYLPNCEFSSDSMVPLSRLTALTRLNTWMPLMPPPASLAALTALRTMQLAICGEEAADASELDAVLPHLQQLTHLSVASIEGVPAACASLPQLQHLFLLDFSKRGERAPQALPPGLTGLRWLAARWDVLARSVPTLAAMPQLQRLYTTTPPDSRDAPEEAWWAFWGWAARHAPLQELCLEAEHGAPTPDDVACALRQLRRSRPALEVHNGSGVYPSHYWEAIDEVANQP